MCRLLALVSVVLACLTGSPPARAADLFLFDFEDDRVRAHREVDIESLAASERYSWSSSSTGRCSSSPAALRWQAEPWTSPCGR